MSSYYVEQRYFDSGRVSTLILTEDEARKKSYYDAVKQSGRYHEELKTCDLWVDRKDSLKAAQKFAKEAREA